MSFKLSLSAERGDNAWNIRVEWLKFVKKLINCPGKTKECPFTLQRDGKSLCQKLPRSCQEVARLINQFFTNIEIAKNIPITNHQFTEYIAASDSCNFNHEAKFPLNPVDSGEILPIVENINIKKAILAQTKFLHNHKQSRITNVP